MPYGVIFPISSREQEPVEPQRGNPAKLVIICDRPYREELPGELVGSFTLWRDSVLVFSNRTLFYDAEMSRLENCPTIVGMLDGSELAVTGWYQWLAVITSPDLDATITLAGDFGLK